MQGTERRMRVARARSRQLGQRRVSLQVLDPATAPLVSIGEKFMNDLANQPSASAVLLRLPHIAAWPILITHEKMGNH